MKVRVTTKAKTVPAPPAEPSLVHRPLDMGSDDARRSLQGLIQSELSVVIAGIDHVKKYGTHNQLSLQARLLQHINEVMEHQVTNYPPLTPKSPKNPDKQRG